MLLWHLWLILIKQLNDHFQWVMITVRGSCVRSGRATRACAMLWIIGGLYFLFILYDFFSKISLVRGQYSHDAIGFLESEEDCL